MTTRPRIAVAAGAIVVVTSLGAGASCSTFSAADEGATDGAAGTDAPFESSNDVATAESSTVDGGSSCTTLIDDKFTTKNGAWMLIGSDEDIANGELVLTPGGDGKDGAAWWGMPLSYTGYLRVRVAFNITNPSGVVGNGFGIGWVMTLPPKIGGLGQSFGMCRSMPPLLGYLFGASTSSSQISILDADACNTNPSGTSKEGAMLNGDHTLLLVIRTYRIDAKLDEGTAAEIPLERDGLVPNAPTTGYLGFAASAVTDSGFSKHVIKSVHVESCSD